MDTDQLSRLIDARLAVLRKLLEFAERQIAAIDDSDLSTLLRLLAGKQQLVEQLQQLDRALLPYQQQDPETRRWPSPEHRTSCQQQARRCEAVLQEILRVEQQAEAIMQQQRIATAQRLDSLQHAGHAQRAYVATPAAATSRLDLSSEG
jgi:flagellar biosynthesis/type III secretory pathway chaperone